MKYRLIYRDGNYNENGHWDKEWDIEFHAVTVMCVANKLRMEGVHVEPDSTTIHLDNIPARVDITGSGTAWLLDEDGARIYPEPYKVRHSETSVTIFVREKEVANGQ